MKKNVLIYFFAFFMLNGCGSEDESINEEKGPLWPKAGEWTEESQIAGEGSRPFTHKYFKRYRNSYYKLWKTMKITKNHSMVKRYVQEIAKRKSRYMKVSQSLGGTIPWVFIGISHVMEGGVGPHFDKHLHNGDPLCGKKRKKPYRTVNVPRGRPTHNPRHDKLCYTWEESAKDAMSLKGFQNWKGWNLIQVWGYAFERYNGFGYRGTYKGKRIGINSPYLWSFTNHYQKGKYYADGKFSWTLVSKQVGAMALLKEFINQGYNPITGGGNVFKDLSPNIGKRCYAMNPNIVGGKHRIVARERADKNSKHVALLNPGSIFVPVDVQLGKDKNLWYKMSFKLGGVEYGKNNPVWVHHDQVDCNNYVGKTCRLETSFGEVISMKNDPKGSVIGTYVPNLTVNVKEVYKNGLWYKVNFKLFQKEHNGWIYRDQLNCTGQKQGFSNRRICMKLLRDGSPIKVRKDPGINNDIEILTTLPLNASTVTSLMKVGNWHAVEFKIGGKNYGVTHGVQAYIYEGQTRPCP